MISDCHNVEAIPLEGCLTEQLYKCTKCDKICYLALTQDPTVNVVLASIIKRSNAGMIKFKGSIHDNPKPPIEWITDAQEELADAIIYLERLKEGLAK